MLALIAGLALPVAGQTVGSESGQTEGCKEDSNGNKASLNQATPAKPKYKPYTADFKITHVQTLGNGAAITQESTMVWARDSQGRVMSSATSILPNGDHTPLTIVDTNDMANATQTSWDSQTKKAKVLKGPPPEQRNGCWQSESGKNKMSFPPAHPTGTVAQSGSTGKPAVSLAAEPQPQRPNVVTEDLGSKTIQGVEAHGRRTTRTISAGVMGNDQPLVITQEDWEAIDLGLKVHSVIDNPQWGKDTTELVKLDQSEPDPALFQPPEGYEIVTEEMVPCKEP
jgi:hypothetical protein